jgi:Ca2+-binding RTX toxin-like protein
MRLRSVFVSVATVGLMVGPAFVHGVLGSVAGAKAECTITGTAANDTINGTTRADVICTKAGQDSADGLEGNDLIRLGQGDDEGFGGDGSDVLKGQADDEQFTFHCVGGGSRPQPQGDGLCEFGIPVIDSAGLVGDDQNDKLYGGQGDDDLFGFNGNDFLKTRDHVSGNDSADGGANTDRCVIDAGDSNTSCDL